MNSEIPVAATRQSAAFSAEVRETREEENGGALLRNYFCRSLWHKQFLNL